mmetsp:Transcript_29748/g.33172  ORF Transcript_29748/g.33172 Transcript_29748/m.33172 type:complete len:170 (+) Transcript_29748:40-549(+)
MDNNSSAYYVASSDPFYTKHITAALEPFYNTRSLTPSVNNKHNYFFFFADTSRSDIFFDRLDGRLNHQTDVLEDIANLNEGKLPSNFTIIILPLSPQADKRIHIGGYLSSIEDHLVSEWFSQDRIIICSESDMNVLRQNRIPNAIKVNTSDLSYKQPFLHRFLFFCGSK